MSLQLVQHETKQFALIVKRCPPGHTLQITDSNSGYKEYECKCNTDDQHIVDCMPDESKILLEVSPLIFITFTYVTYIHRKVFGLIM